MTSIWQWDPMRSPCSLDSRDARWYNAWRPSSDSIRNRSTPLAPGWAVASLGQLSFTSRHRPGTQQPRTCCASHVFTGRTCHRNLMRSDSNYFQICTASWPGVEASVEVRNAMHIALLQRDCKNKTWQNAARCRKLHEFADPDSTPCLQEIQVVTTQLFRWM